MSNTNLVSEQTKDTDEYKKILDEYSYADESKLSQQTVILGRFGHSDTLTATKTIREILKLHANAFLNAVISAGSSRVNNLNIDSTKAIETSIPLSFSLRLNHGWSEMTPVQKITEEDGVKVKDFKMFVTTEKYQWSSSWYRNTVNEVLKTQVLLNILGNDIWIETSFDFLEGAFGARFSENMNVVIGNQIFTIDLPKIMRYDLQRPYSERKFLFRLSDLNSLTSSMGIRDGNNKVTLARHLIVDDKYNIPDLDIRKKGITKVYKKVLPFVEDKKISDPLSFYAFRSLVEECNSSIDSVKVSVVFNQTFGEVENKDDYKELIKNLKSSINKSTYSSSINDFIKSLPVYAEKRKKVLKSQSTRAFSKLMQEYEFLKLDEESYPVTTAAIKEGELPISIFFRKQEQYFLLNDNFDLWEEMLTRHKDITLALAKTASKRTTYEKDLMSYFYFVLYALPEYLEKHTGKRWTCSPKLVDSPSELNPPSEGEDGITRKRSALTPIVDNEENTVVIPYASLAMPGRQTTYCYSHSYNVLQKGLTFAGNTVCRDLEEKLNGRDDYGLMFYTLTGSEQGRGYPTFLIIFERLQTFGKKTRVHFHRTHPCRSKSGDYNPIHNWIKVCYNWMAGNVNKNMIIAQQGDLVFVEDKIQDREYDNRVDFYDKHVFDRSVEYAPYTNKKKDNILGYVCLDEDNILHHSEHEDVPLPKGRYAIRQCRSWEANPQGVWSLRID